MMGCRVANVVYVNKERSFTVPFFHRHRLALVATTQRYLTPSSYLFTAIIHGYSIDCCFPSFKATVLAGVDRPTGLLHLLKFTVF